MIGPQPKISVVIAVRNGAATLQRALDSVFEQTYDPVELIVMDGASTDGTVPILRHNSDRIHYWESKSDRGIHHAWNKALDRATGEWICFLGADDRLHAADVLERISSELARASDQFRVVYGAVRVLRSDGTVDRIAGRPWEDARPAFLAGEMIPHQGTFHQRSLFEVRGRFDESFGIAGDYEFLLRELLDSDALFALGVTVVDMGAGGLSDRPAHAYRILREIHRARTLHGLEFEPAWRSGPIIRTLIRVWIIRIFGARTAGVVSSIYRFMWRRRRAELP